MPPDARITDEAAAMPPKYIRTLEGDSKMLKEGKRPDLVPLASSAPPAPPQPVSPPPVSAPPPPLPDEYIRTFDADMQVAGKGAHPDLAPFTPNEPKREFMPRPQPIVAPPLQPPSPPESPLHTYSGDFSDLVKREGASRASILAAEQDAPKRAAAPAKPSAPRSRAYLFGGILLFALGAAGAYYAYANRARAPVAAVVPAVFAPIFVDERQEIGGSPAELMQAIEASAARALAADKVRFLYTASATSTGNSVFAALELPAPGALLRNVNARGSMAGVVSTRAGQAPFFLLSVASYADTFAALLSWERAPGALSIPDALAAFFPPFPDEAQSASSTDAAAAASFAPGWRDETVENHDARAYRDARGRTLMLYGYADANTLLIARDEAAFAELLARLATSRAR